MTVKLDEGALQAAYDAVISAEDTGVVTLSDIARAAVTAYLAAANRLRPMSEAPYRGDNGRPYVLGYLEGDRKEPVMVWRFGKSMVDENRQHYQFEEFDGWLRLPEPTEAP